MHTFPSGNEQALSDSKFDTTLIKANVVRYQNWKIRRNIQVNLNIPEEEDGLSNCLPAKYNNLRCGP